MKTEPKNTRAAVAAQRRRQRLLVKLAAVRHWLLGALAVAPVPGTVFDPLPLFLDPGRLPALLAYWRYRASRAGVGAGLPAALRASALDAAAQACLTHFLDADYAALGITADEWARAALYALRRCRLAFWSDADGSREIDRERRSDRHGGNWRLYNRAQASRTPDPRRIVHAADALGMDPNAVDGRGITDEVPGDVVTIPGGPSGRGETDGKMIRATVADVVRAVDCFTWDGQQFTPDRMKVQQTRQRWTMRRGRGMARRLPPCTVREGIPAPRPVFNPPAPPAAGLSQPDGIINGRRPRQPLPTVTAADALYNLRRLGRGLDAPADRQRIARAIRAHRAAVRAN